MPPVDDDSAWPVRREGWKEDEELSTDGDDEVPVAEPVSEQDEEVGDSEASYLENDARTDQSDAVLSPSDKKAVSELVEKLVDGLGGEPSVVQRESQDGESQAPQKTRLEEACEKQHPANRSDTADMTPKEIMECYAFWHRATLDAWRKEPLKCEGRRTRIHRATAGLGDSGKAFTTKFYEAVLHGDMIFWLFPENRTVWELAMVAPFDWDFKASGFLFCLDNRALQDLMQSPAEYVVGKCPQCRDPRILLSGTNTALQQRSNEKAFASSKEIWEFLYRPTEDVQQAVQNVLGQVRSSERLVGVHYRGQWFGNHHGCGCLDVQEAPRCMLNIGQALHRRGVSGFEKLPRLRYFVASDQFAALDAFRETFGDEVMTLPNVLPLEHSLSVTAAGAKRLFAEFLILSHANAFIGACGSTFTHGVKILSGLHNDAVIETGTDEARACAANVAGIRNFSGFAHSRFAVCPWAPGRCNWSKACGCYGEDEQTSTTRGGICEFACTKAEQRPPKCPVAGLWNYNSLLDLEQSEHDVGASIASSFPWSHQAPP
jgi:hypothetical protein